MKKSEQSEETLSRNEKERIGPHEEAAPYLAETLIKTGYRINFNSPYKIIKRFYFKKAYSLYIMKVLIFGVTY